MPLDAQAAQLCTTYTSKESLNTHVSQEIGVIVFPRFFCVFGAWGFGLARHSLDFMRTVEMLVWIVFPPFGHLSRAQLLLK